MLAIHSADAPRLAAGQTPLSLGWTTSTSWCNRLLQDGDTITAGSLSFTVIHTPGHTPGGICLYGHNMLFAGDTLFAGGIGRADLPGGDYETLINSITRRLLVLPGDTLVYSGHGTTTIEQEKNNNPFLS